jgi:hypothetical protein
MGNFLLLCLIATALLVPVSIIVNGPFGVEVNFTCPGQFDYGLLHLSIIANYTCRVVPGNTLGLSVTADIVAELTTIFEVTVLQFVGLFTSQMV